MEAMIQFSLNFHPTEMNYSSTCMAVWHWLIIGQLMHTKCLHSKWFQLHCKILNQIFRPFTQVSSLHLFTASNSWWNEGRFFHVWWRQVDIQEQCPSVIVQTLRWSVKSVPSKEVYWAFCLSSHTHTLNFCDVASQDRTSRSSPSVVTYWRWCRSGNNAIRYPVCN